MRSTPFSESTSTSRRLVKVYGEATKEEARKLHAAGNPLAKVEH
jgi:hypothetical protein